MYWTQKVSECLHNGEGLTLTHEQLYHLWSEIREPINYNKYLFDFNFFTFLSVIIICFTIYKLH